MTKGFESVGARIQELPKSEATWIERQVKRISKMLDSRDQFPDMLFDGRPYDEQTAHLRLLQFHLDSIGLGFSDFGRQAMLDIAIEYGAAVELPQDVMQANWQQAIQEERTPTNRIKVAVYQEDAPQLQ